MDRRLSIPGGLTGALLGLAAELALEEITGIDIVNGLLAVIGAGFIHFSLQGYTFIT